MYSLRHTSFSCKSRKNTCYSDECNPSPCPKNATYLKNQEGFKCKYPQGFTGKNCEENIDDGISNPRVQGQCFDQIRDYFCKCTQGFTGMDCEENIDDCISNPCV